MWNKKHADSVVVLLQRTQLSVFRSTTGKVEVLTFDPKLVQDLEVLDEAGFSKSLTLFLQQLKLTKGFVILVLDSTIYFTQQAGQVDQDQELKSKLEVIEKEKKSAEQNEKTESVDQSSDLENNRKLFAQSVPFSDVFSATVTVGKVKFFLALNRDFYEPVVKAFSEHDLHVSAILPMVVVNQIFEQVGFSPESASALIGSVEKYKAHDFLETSMKTEVQAVTAMPSDPSDKRRLLLMVVVFVILIGVLVGVVLWSRQRDQQLATPPLPSSTPVIESTPLPSVVPQDAVPSPESSQSSEIIEDGIGLTIIDASGGATSSALLRDQLRSAGYTQLEVIDGSATISGPLIISYGQDSPLDLVESVAETIKNLGYVTRLDETSEQAGSIQITLTRQ